MTKRRMSLSHNRLLRIAEDAALLIAALMLSYLEAVFPLGAVLPIPGAKLGLANLAVMAAYHRHSLADAAAVSFSRVLLSAVLFGRVSSFAFSLTGAAFALLVIAAVRRCLSRYVSWIGTSVLAACAHNVGQLLCAVVWLHSWAVAAYLPVLLLLAVLFGFVSGGVMNVLAARIPAVNRKESTL